jgi:hypothetical protein
MYSVFPLYRSATDWLHNPGHVWLSWSVFNPSGPTISCLGLRDTGSAGQAEVFYRWLHFLGGEDYCLGYVDTRGSDSRNQLHEILSHAFCLEARQVLRRFAMVSTIPSVVLVTAPDDWSAPLKELMSSARAIRTADWGRERYLLQKYGSHLFDRAGEETREGYETMRSSELAETAENQQFLELLRIRHEHIESFSAWEPGQYTSRELQDGDIDAWWTTVTDADSLPPVAFQFAHAWVGAASQVSVECKTPLEEVRDFFLAYSHLWWPDNVTTAGILRRFRGTT